MIYVVDIDGTICTDTGGDYERADPHEGRITTINNLFDAGHTIIYCTARGMDSCKGNQQDAAEKYYQYTLQQLNTWGCKYHALYLGKPKADLYVDDKGIKDVDFFGH